MAEGLLFQTPCSYRMPTVYRPIVKKVSGAGEKNVKTFRFTRVAKSCTISMAAGVPSMVPHLAAKVKGGAKNARPAKGGNGIAGS